MYHKHPAKPHDRDLRVVEAGAHLAGNAIERLRAEEKLRENAERIAMAEKAAAFGIWQTDVASGYGVVLGRIRGVSWADRKTIAHAPGPMARDDSPRRSRLPECHGGTGDGGIGIV